MAMSDDKGDTQPVTSNRSKSLSGISGGTLVLSLLIAGAAVFFAWQHQQQQARNLEQCPSGAPGLSVDDAMNSTTVTLLPYHELFSEIVNSDDFRVQWQKLQASLRAASTQDASLVGERMAESGSKALHPVFMLPGFVTSGLELWQGHECAKTYFRKKIWGSLETFRSFVNDKECWKEHLSLDPVTGMDPPGVRLRTAQGFEAADFWTSSFWVWDRIIRNLAAVGYDGSNMALEGYDWRMSYPELEKRDGHFSKLKRKIEAFVEHSGEKAVIMGHSMGAPHVFFFLVWVSKPTEEGGGGGGSDWVEKYIHAYVDIAGPMLGLPKAASALLSGEMKDVNILSTFASIIESLFGRKKRVELFSSWGALWSMTPKGGDLIWGVAADIDCGEGRIHKGDSCVDGTDPKEASIPFLTFTDSTGAIEYKDATFSEFASKSSWSFGDVMRYFRKWKSGEHGPKSLEGPGSWTDPTVHPLPNAPSLNVYCLYGVGLKTDRMFYYRKQAQETGDSDLPFIMDQSVKDDVSENIEYGIKMTNGDGSVPLLSLGYMCAEGWKEGSHLNPGNSRVVTKEYTHEGSFQMEDPLRQGPKSGEHCDILGNHEVLEDVIRIASGESLEARFVSDIQGIAQRIREHPINNT